MINLIQRLKKLPRDKKLHLAAGFIIHVSAYIFAIFTIPVAGQGGFSLVCTAFAAWLREYANDQHEDHRLVVILNRLKIPTHNTGFDRKDLIYTVIPSVALTVSHYLLMFAGAI